jgi:hypothetical protein
VRLLPDLGLSPGIGVLNAVNDRSAENDAKNQVKGLVPGKDILVVRGTWVWDGGHIPQGWNEFHPVFFAQRIGSVPKTDLLEGQPWQNLSQFSPANLPNMLNQVCGLTAIAIDPGIHIVQQAPKTAGPLHPVVDGCTQNPQPPPQQTQ